MGRPKIICVTGLDGSGKSTIIKGLCEKIGGARHTHIWKLLDKTQNLLFKNKADIDKYLCLLTPNARLQFLSHALMYAIECDLNSGSSILFLNAYYYKYFAMELTFGCDKNLVKDIMKSFPVPDITFYLNVPIEIAAERKTNYSRYESGAVEVPDKDSFIKFQQACLPNWEVFERQNWVSIDATKSPDAIISEILNHMNL